MTTRRSNTSGARLQVAVLEYQSRPYGAFVRTAVTNTGPGRKIFGERALTVGQTQTEEEGMNELNDLEPRERLNPNWRLISAERLSAEENRPGLKKMYVTVLDDKGEPLAGLKVRFDTEPSKGIVYDHANWWGVTDENGYVEWNHLGKPTRYLLYMENGLVPLVENIRTDLGNEYYKPPGSHWWSGNRPINRPGIYSYRIRIVRRW